MHAVCPCVLGRQTLFRGINSRTGKAVDLRMSLHSVTYGGQPLLKAVYHHEQIEVLVALCSTYKDTKSIKTLPSASQIALSALHSSSM